MCSTLKLLVLCSPTHHFTSHFSFPSATAVMIFTGKWDFPLPWIAQSWDSLPVSSCPSPGREMWSLGTIFNQHYSLLIVLVLFTINTMLLRQCLDIFTLNLFCSLWRSWQPNVTYSYGSFFMLSLQRLLNTSGIRTCTWTKLKPSLTSSYLLQK